MGDDKLHRWERRRGLRAKASLHFQMFDLIGVIFLFSLFFFTLRIFQHFYLLRSPCVEWLTTIGRTQSQPSIMEMSLGVSLAFGLFWIAVMFNTAFSQRLAERVPTARIIFQFIILIGIFLLVIANRSMVSERYVQPPDGVLNVTWDFSPDQSTPAEPNWRDYKDGQWYASGAASCVWLDRNEVSYVYDWRKRDKYSIFDIMGLGKPHIDILMDNQRYRPLTAYERERFLRKQACQADISLYGQRRTICEGDDIYPVEPGRMPSPELIEALGFTELMLGSEPLPE